MHSYVNTNNLYSIDVSDGVYTSGNPSLIEIINPSWVTVILSSGSRIFTNTVSVSRSLSVYKVKTLMLQILFVYTCPRTIGIGTNEGTAKRLSYSNVGCYHKYLQVFEQ